MSNVRPGMLARVINPGGKAITPEIVGRIVFVERKHEVDAIITDVGGRMFRNNSPYSELAWMISASIPLPFRFAGVSETLYTYERPLLDVCLKPLIDPDLGVTEDEVCELYYPKEVVPQ
jgi:hypothetical protein